MVKICCKESFESRGEQEEAESVSEEGCWRQSPPWPVRAGRVGWAEQSCDWKESYNVKPDKTAQGRAPHGRKAAQQS